MQRIADYQVLTAYDSSQSQAAASLREVVVAQLEAGWYPLGGVSFWVAADESGDTAYWLSQAMVMPTKVTEASS